MKRTILVIEDNEQNLYLFTYLLKKAGYDIVQARDGAAGVEAAIRRTPDLILLDIQLPEMDGYTVFRELQARPELRAVPVVAVTSYAMPGDRERMLEMGFSGYFAKPIDPNAFPEDLKPLFDVQRGTDASE